MMKPLCIYHGKCADGFTAAWAVWKKLGDAVEFHSGVYQEPPPTVTGRDVLLVDFSYKRAVLDEMAQSAESILILDHHKTAAEDLTPFTVQECGAGRISYLDVPGMFRDLVELGRPPIMALFDMERSGAGLTWDVMHAGSPRPKLVDYVEDRDLWRFNLEGSREVNAYIFAHDYDFDQWENLAHSVENHLYVVIDLGGAIEKKHHKDVRELVSVTRRPMTIGGFAVPVANLPYTLTSDAGNLMAEGEPFAACYWDTPEGRVFSLRSTDDGEDVSAIAKQYGGGGHRNASGFRVSIGWEGDIKD